MAEGSPQRPFEQPAVRTTIVGGRPPGSGKGVGDIPRGIEVLVKKASVDAEFRALLLARRADAAQEIGLELAPAEALMLRSVPAAQLESIIAQTTVSPLTRAAFLGRAAGVMLAALGAGAGCRDSEEPPQKPETKGIRPDYPRVEGIQPDRPEKQNVRTTGIRPDLPATQDAPSPPPAAKTPAAADPPMVPIAGAVARAVERQPAPKDEAK